MNIRRELVATALSAAFFATAPACAPASDDAVGEDDLPLGDTNMDDLKDDGSGWGAALTCKTPPSLPQLVNPRITISLNGLSLHLTDSTGFDKVFPIGVGQIEKGTYEALFGESLSYYPIYAYDKNDFQITPSSIQPCKTWWTDPDTGKKSPVFAGLPFMSWSGSYAIHGPIDNFRAPNGGTLRRGYVSHGCIRMEAADVLEVYARIKGVAKVPVHVQREPERTGDGEKVDVPSKWIGAECTSDSECAYSNGFCKQNAWSGRGFCSARCTRTCADRAGNPTTFCVADPESTTGQGMCVAKHVAENWDCRPYDHFVPATRSRNTEPATTAKVCIPGSPGWVGDRCFSDADCGDGTGCAGAEGGEAGVCTMPCDRYCADEPGYPSTFCVAEGTGGRCLRQCTTASNASECAAEQDCVSRSRRNEPATVRNVCVPN
jgi:hypothetical protein